MSRSDEEARADTLRLGARGVPLEERPYGTEGGEVDDSKCRKCWSPRYVWDGNFWVIPHLPPGLSTCRHECHKDEVWMASAARSAVSTIEDDGWNYGGDGNPRSE